MTSPSLVDKVIGVHRSLRRIPHAFGGALALAYYAEPRATVDIDVNVFVEPDRFDVIARRLLATGVEVDASAHELVARDGQVRVFWAGTPIDLFFAYDPFHDAAAAARVTVPFAGTTIPILAAEHLFVCKAVFNRSKDWVDIDAALALGTNVDVAEVLRWVGRVVGDEDPRFERMAAVLSRSH